MNHRNASLLSLVLVGISGATALAQYPGIRTPNWSGPQRYERQPQVRFNPWGGVTIDTGREDIYDSAYDQNRDYVDPGSVRVLNETYYDAQGRLVRRSGREWTSFGVPHGDVKTTVVSNLGGGSQSVDTSVVLRDSTTQRYLSRPSGRTAVSSGPRNINRQPAAIRSSRPSPSRRGLGR